MEKIMR